MRCYSLYITLMANVYKYCPYSILDFYVSYKKQQGKPTVEVISVGTVFFEFKVLTIRVTIVMLSLMQLISLLRDQCSSLHSFCATGLSLFVDTAAVWKEYATRTYTLTSVYSSVHILPFKQDAFSFSISILYFSQLTCFLAQSHLCVSLELKTFYLFFLFSSDSFIQQVPKQILNGEWEKCKVLCEQLASDKNIGFSDGQSNQIAFFDNCNNPGGHCLTAQKHQRLYLSFGMSCEYKKVT